MKKTFKWIGIGLLALAAFVWLANVGDADGRWITLYIVLGIAGWQATKIFDDYKRQALLMLTQIEQRVYKLSQQADDYSPVLEELLAEARQRSSKPL